MNFPHVQGTPSAHAAGTRKSSRPLMLAACGLLLGSTLTVAACGDLPFPTDLEMDAETAAGTHLVVTPRSHLAAAGEVVPFTVVAVRSDGTPVDDPGVKWTTSDAAVATVDEQGVVSAHGEGTATIRASLGRASADSRIDVLDEEESDPPPAAESREPAGYSLVTDRAFSARDDAGWLYNSSSRFTIVTDESAPHACCSVGQAHFEKGYAGGTSPVTTWFGFAGRRHTELYMSFWLKLSDNWQGHSSHVNKVAFAWIHGDASVYLSAQGSGSGSLRPQIRLQAVPDGARNLTRNVNDAKIERGKWHHWEVQLISNSDGNPNGIARLWLDGELLSEHHDVRYSSANQGREWELLYWNPVWGGMGDTVEQDQYMRIDHFYASGR